MSRTKGSRIAPHAPLANPPEPRHDEDVVQFYTEDSSLLDGLAQFIGDALKAGDAAVVVATKEHRNGLASRLQVQGFDLASAIDEGRYIALDAAETLTRFILEEWPSAERFFHVVGGIIARAETAAQDEHRRVVIFGEMVALLWDEGKIEAAIRLEQLWNNLAERHSISLRCTYPMEHFQRGEHGEPFLRICVEHSGVIPGESYMSLMKDEERLRVIAYLQQKAQALKAETALRQSEEIFRLLVESVRDYAIFMLTVEGHVNSWNIGAEHIKGYKASEIIGRHFSCFYPEEDIRSGKPQRHLDAAANQGRSEDEGWRVRKDGSRFWANVIITASRDECGRLCGFSKVTRDVTEKMQAHEALRRMNEELRGEIVERKAAEERLHDSERSLQKLSRHLFRMQDEERQRIGRELHDSVGQDLAVLKMGLDSLACDLPQMTNANAVDQQLKVTECLRLVDQAIREVRTISYLLYPPMLEEMGLGTAIQWYLDGFSKRSGIQVTFDIPPDSGRLPHAVELALFRVLQEGLTNVHRHSGSATADVRVWVENHVAILEVKDKGKGIPPNILGSTRDAGGMLGVGLRGMNERVRHLGGKLELFSSEKGTVVRATVPCQESAFATGVSE